ncbi:hypothetical protein ACMDCT_03045 [Halomonadaceae bacterium KBTZ08]
MTGRVHVLTKSPEHPRHERCLALLSPEDTLILTAAAIERLSPTEPVLPVNAGRVLVLAETPEALPIPLAWEALDHAGFVERILRHHQPVFW